MAKVSLRGFNRASTLSEFQADNERQTVFILEREASNGFKPAKGQFQIYYKSGADHLEYQPTSLLEDSAIYMLEPKRLNARRTRTFLAKKEGSHRMVHPREMTTRRTYRGKPEVPPDPHDVIAETSPSNAENQFG